MLYRPLYLLSALISLTFFTSSASAISGGVMSYQGDWPSMVTIQSKSLDRHVCGATLVAPGTAMTAAHCVLGKDVSDMEVYVGAYDAVYPVTERFDVVEVLVHPNYSTRGPKNDIALMYLDGQSNQPVMRLNTSTSSFSTYIAAGWGENGAGSMNRYLHEVDLNHANGCSASFPFNSNIHLCAGGQGAKSTCPGDSGGPVVVRVNGRAYQVGIVSTGTSTGYLRCGVEGAYNVFTKVSSFVTWVNQNLERDSEPPIDPTIPSGSACNWSTTPFYGNGNQQGSIYMYAPVGPCAHTVKEVENANGRITTRYR